MEEQEHWTPKDIFPGIAFVVMGVLVILYVLLAMKNEVPFSLWGAGWLVGPLFLFIGGNSID